MRKKRLCWVSIRSSSSWYRFSVQMCVNGAGRTAYLIYRDAIDAQIHRKFLEVAVMENDLLQFIVGRHASERVLGARGGHFAGSSQKVFQSVPMNQLKEKRKRL